MCFLTVNQVRRLFGRTKWWMAAQEQCKECPWFSMIFGAVCWKLSGFEENYILERMCQCARGPLVRIDVFDHWHPVVVKQDVREYITAILHKKGSWEVFEKRWITRRRWSKYVKEFFSNVSSSYDVKDKSEGLFSVSEDWRNRGVFIESATIKEVPLWLYSLASIFEDGMFTGKFEDPNVPNIPKWQKTKVRKKKKTSIPSPDELD